MLTGESMPVSKNLSPAPERAGLGDRKCLAYSATSVSSGQGLGVVVATGDAAEIGQINKMVSEVRAACRTAVIRHFYGILGCKMLYSDKQGRAVPDDLAKRSKAYRA